jgi:hypothetical protein
VAGVVFGADHTIASPGRSPDPRDTTGGGKGLASEGAKYAREAETPERDGVPRRT